MPMRILIIEDNAAFRDSLRALLYSCLVGVDVLEAGDGDGGLKLSTRFQPDLIFVDIQLPDQNGLQVARAIKDASPQTPVAILTSYDLPEYRDAADDCGANHFLGKDSTDASEICGLVDRYRPV